MRLLVSGATATLRTLPAAAPVGHLLTPANGNRIAVLLATGRKIAVDNAAFSGFDERAWFRMTDALGRAGGWSAERVWWCAVPDVVANAAETLARWKWYHHQLRALWLPAAFVAQDGCAALYIPWHKFACLFIGGSTAWKLGEEAARLIVEAKRRGKLVHIGRVNSFKRLQIFEGLGVDSFDGGQFSRFPATYIPRYLDRLRYRQEQFTIPQRSSGYAAV